MTCPNCQTQNKRGANFCKNCGLLLATNCPRCQAVVQEHARFCDNCRLPFGNTSDFEIPTQGVYTVSEDADGQTISVPPKPAPACTQSSTPQPSAHSVTTDQASKPAEDRLKLNQIISKEMRAKLNSARAKNEMVGERRIVTMLFCDVKGSTQAAKQLDPEEWAEIMNEGFEYMINPIYKYEGTVARLMGDAILAFFGAPIAHEDDPKRAILAGLDIVKEFAPYRERVKQEWGIDVNARVGINTGMVMVGQVGNDLQMEYTAMGDAINLAARMEQTAQPGTVQISEDTYKNVYRAFEFEDLGSVEVKGKKRPIRIYRPLTPKAGTVSGRGFEELDTPLIGRGSEWARLKTAGKSLSKGIGQIVFITGEAGLGKSRLIQELKNEWDKGSISDLQAGWYETSSLSYETSKPYGMFQRLLRSVLDAKANNTNEEQREMIAEMVNDFSPEEISNARKAFESLFSLNGEDGNPPLEGEQFKQNLFRVFSMLWAQRAQTNPIVLVLDDLHWADPASVELLEHLFLLTNSVPIMFICSTRLERKAPSWHLRQVAEESYAHRLTQINVRPLTEEDSIQLVENLMRLSDIPEGLRDRILEKTEGNPFFVEEMVRTLQDIGLNGRSKTDPIRLEKIKSGEIDIPDNIQSLLIAKIDRLKEDERHTLQLAAIIGRSFYYSILEMISEENPDNFLPHQINVFQQMDLIREAARHPELEYSFIHGLTQEAAYSTILHKQRRSFHRQVAEAIETLFDDRSEEMVATLAHHFDNAHVFDKAFHYSVEAGNQAFHLYAMKESIEHYSRAVSYLDKIEVNSQQLINVYNRLGRSLELNSDFKAALKNYEKMEKLAKNNDDRSLELSSIIAQATIYSNVNDQGNPERGLSLSKHALTIARELKDEPTEVKIQWNLLNALRFSEKVDEAVAAGERALKLARKLELPYENAIAANDLALPLLAAGQSERAREVLEEARGLWREQSNQPMLANSLATASLVHSLSGDFDQSLDFSNEAYKISKSIQNSWGLSYSHFSIGNVYWQRGHPGKAIQAFETVMKYGEEANFSVAGVWSRAFLARIYLRLGHINFGVELAEAAVTYAEKNAPPWKLMAAGVLAQARIKEGNFEQAEVLIQECRKNELSGFGSFLSIFQVEEPAIQLALLEEDAPLALRLAEETIEKISAYNYLMYRPDALLLKAQVELFAKKTDQANTTLAEAQKEAEMLKTNWVLWQVYHARAQVLRDEDKQDESKVLGVQARTIIDDITDNMNKETLKESFLALAQVRAVIQSSETADA